MGKVHECMNNAVCRLSSRVTHFVHLRVIGFRYVKQIGTRAPNSLLGPGTDPLSYVNLLSHPCHPAHAKRSNGELKGQ